MNRVIFHIDMDCFFVQVEQQVDSSLRGEPVAVVNRGRALVLSSSYEARHYNVRTGMPLKKALELCPMLKVVYSNPDRYEYASQQIVETLLDFTDHFEQVSVDEFFIDATSVLACQSGAEGTTAGRQQTRFHELALGIKNTLREKTGLASTIGISTNRELAKLAADIGKPDGLVELYPDNFLAKVGDLSVDKLYGVGSKSAQLLNSLGIFTIREISNAPLKLLIDCLGIRGFHLKNIANGLGSGHVKHIWDQEEPKSVGHSCTLPRNTDNLDVVKSYILLLTDKVATRLRKCDLLASIAGLRIRFEDFSELSAQLSLADLTDDPKIIYSSCLQLFERSLPLRAMVRLVGVHVSGLKRQEPQLFLFDHRQKKMKLLEAVDSINYRFGTGSLRPAYTIVAEQFGRTEKIIPPTFRSMRV